jgi:hypothetical protein
MLWRPLRTRADGTIFALIFLLLLVVAAVNDAQKDVPNSSGLDLSYSDLVESDKTSVDISGNSNGNSSVSATKSAIRSEDISENKSYERSFNVHVYVSNNDDDSLEASLFIDSELMDTKDISSGSEKEIGTYPLNLGPHSFKITWWDEDTKESYGAEETKQIQNETSVNLYTTQNKELEEFDVSVKLTNENPKELEAYLYVDDNFEKNKIVSKESTSDMGTISLAEGIHNLSVRWRDKDTKIEYEKKKTILVSRDEAVIFYVPQGISFKAMKSSAAHNSDSTSSWDEEQPSAAEQFSSNMYVTNDHATSGNESKNRTFNGKLNETFIEPYPKKSDATSVITYSSDNISKIKAEKNSGYSNEPEYSSASRYSSVSSISKKSSSSSRGILDNSDDLYIYSGLVVLAIYLIFRHHA